MSGRMSALVGKKTDDHIAIQKLTRESSNCAIKARVSRLWDLFNLKNKKEIISTDMVLIDEEGSYIHASIKGSWAHLFRGSIVEGSVYYIKHFAVVDNKPRFRVVGDNKVMLQLYANSTVIPICDETSSIPRHRFDLVSFDKVATRMGQDYILTDVVGRVCSEADIVLKPIHNRMVPCLMLELQDVREVKLRLTLWDESIEDYMEQKKAIKGNIVAGVFTSNLVKEFMNCATLSSTTASKVYLNIDIDKVFVIKSNSFWANESTISPLLLQREVVDRDTILAGLKNISEILRIAATDFENGSSFFCHALLYDINNNNGWFCNSCGYCKRLIKPCGETFWCNKCEKIVDDVVPRYRLDVGVKDDKECTRFIIFDDEAQKIIGQTAMSVHDMQEKLEDNELDRELPVLIGNLIGCRYVFRVKLTEYNKSAYKQSFTAIKVFAESILDSKKTSKASTSSQEDLMDDSPSKKRCLSEGIDQREGKALEE